MSSSLRDNRGIYKLNFHNYSIKFRFKLPSMKSVVEREICYLNLGFPQYVLFNLKGLLLS